MNINELEADKLLIIDDEEEMLKSLKRLFRKDYHVYLANNAKEAFEIMEKNKINVVLSDQRMPDITGEQFFERIKTEYPDAVRLILTGYADIADVIQAINDGNIFRYVTKPWNPVELKTIIHEAFEKYKLVVSNKLLLEELKKANEVLEKKVKERTKELALANEHLQKVNKQKDEFLGIAAHDLRNPIGVIREFSYYLANRNNISSDQRQEILGYIKNSSQFMLNLINDLLDITKIESGKLDLQIAENDFLNCIKENIHFNSLIAEKKSIKLTLAPLPLLTKFNFDQRKITQVLNNLVSNAIKYSNSNTEITVEVENRGTNVLTKVIDQGLGIPKDEMDKIFKPFGKTSVVATNGEKSTGLGLAIVKKIVEGHGGTIDVQSTPGEGSTFSFSLPL